MSPTLYSFLDPRSREIRLLELIPKQTHGPADTSEPIHCKLGVFSLTEPPAYTALSYVWGEATIKKPIFINGVEVEITANLDEALRHFAQGDEPVLVWADALSINQEDGLEKGVQLQMMKNIYQHASTVLIWQGPGDEASDKAMDFFHNTGLEASAARILDLEPPDIKEILSRHPKESLSVTKNDLERMIDRIGWNIPWLELISFLSHPWYSRIWVLQEAAVPSDAAVVIARGKKTLPFREFMAALCYVTFTGYYAGYHGPMKLKGWSSTVAEARERFNCRGATRVCSYRRKFHQEGNRERETLLALLIRSHERYTVDDVIQASDPRDRIFALLGIAKDEPGFSIHPSYKASVSDVYSDVAAAFLNCGHFDILALSQFPKKEHKLPSWVPDWTGYIQRPCSNYKKDGIYNASGDKAPSISFHFLPGGLNILSIRGCVVDTVTKLGNPWEPAIKDWQEWTSSNDRCAAYFDSISAFCAESDALGCDIYTQPSQRLEAHWRVPCANQAHDQFYKLCRPSASGAELLEGYTYIRQGRSPYAVSSEHSQRVRTFRITMGSLFKRRPFISTKGYVGLVPSHSEPGDVICVLYGCIVPFVLRENGFGYNLIGEAYVHGIMDGEFVAQAHEVSAFDIY